MPDSTLPKNEEQTPSPVPSPPSEKPFTPPASQADFDRIIGERVQRERAKFADYEELKTKAAEFDAAQEAAKSEAQKQAEALAEAQKKVEEFERREQVAKWAAEVSAETKIPADVLVGDSLEEIRAFAEKLKAHGFGAPQKQASDPIPGIGQVPETPSNFTIDQQIAQAEANGDRDLAKRLKAMKLTAK